MNSIIIVNQPDITTLTEDSPVDLFALHLLPNYSERLVEQFHPIAHFCYGDALKFFSFLTRKRQQNQVGRILNLSLIVNLFSL